MKVSGDGLEARRLYLPWQDDEECAWLQRMHSDGWALDSLGFGRYRFKRCEGEATVYRLDFRWLRTGDEPEYLALFSEAGWELAARGKGWYYFRAKAQGCAVGEIYTDFQSRRRMYGAMLGFIALISLPSLVFVFVYPMRPDGASGIWLDIYGILKLVIGAVLALQALAAVGIARRMSRLGKGVND